MDCFENERTKLTDATTGQAKIYIDRGKLGKHVFKLNLPAGMSCNHCVFQVDYNHKLKGEKSRDSVL
jgi:hypothetical protein